MSLQNGVGNGGVLKSALPGFDVRAGMVPFNIVSMGGGRFHRGTSGDIVIEKGPGLACLDAQRQGADGA